MLIFTQVRIHKTLELADDKFYMITCGKAGFQVSLKNIMFSFEETIWHLIFSSESEQWDESGDVAAAEGGQEGPAGCLRQGLHSQVRWRHLCFNDHNQSHHYPHIIEKLAIFTQYAFCRAHISQPDGTFGMKVGFVSSNQFEDCVEKSYFRWNTVSPSPTRTQLWSWWTSGDVRSQPSCQSSGWSALKSIESSSS